MAGWHTIFGKAVRERRQALGLTLEEASRAIGISRSHLNLIELGKATGVSREAAKRIDAGLDASGTLLVLVPSGDESPAEVTARGEEMRRAAFNKALLTIGATLLLDPERAISAGGVDPALLSDLESLTADLAHRQHRSSPQAVLGPLRAHLRHLLDLEQERMPLSLQPRLARVTAETAAVAGWVAFRGTGDLVTAHAQMALAREQANAASDDKLIAELLGASSSLYSSLDIPHGHGDQASTLALSLLQAAQRRAPAGASALQGWLAARLAVEEAVLGEGRRARAALARAEASVPSGQPDASGGLFVIWNEARLPGFSGKALLLLGDPAAAALLEEALAATSAPHPRFGLLVDLAMASVSAGDPDHGVTLLLDATQLAVERGIDRFARWRLREGRARLPAVHQRSFDRQLPVLA